MRNLAAAFAVLALAVPAQAGAAASLTKPSTSPGRSQLEPGGTLRLKNFSGRVTITGVRSPRGRDRRGPPRAASAARPDQARHPHLRARTWSWSTPTSATARGGRSPAATTWSRPTSTSRCRAAPSSTCRCSARPVTVTGVEGPHNAARIFIAARAERRHRLGPGAHVQRIGHHPREVLGSPTRPSTSTPSAAASSCTSRTTARGTVTFNSFSGHLNSDMPLTMHSSSRRSLRAELGGGGEAGRCASRPSAAASRSTGNPPRQARGRPND